MMDGRSGPGSEWTSRIFWSNPESLKARMDGKLQKKKKKIPGEYIFNRICII
jgi:hypothetical protein